jgi:hypothetical protein
MRSRTRSAPVYQITGVRTPLSADLRGRTRRYLISMGLRTACFLGAIVAHGPLRWALVLCAVVLPWISVIGANAGREPDRDLPGGVQHVVDPAVLGPPAPPDPSPAGPERPGP